MKLMRRKVKLWNKWRVVENELTDYATCIKNAVNFLVT
jgi:hypothetical protein